MGTKLLKNSHENLKVIVITFDLFSVGRRVLQMVCYKIGDVSKRQIIRS